MTDDTEPDWREAYDRLWRRTIARIRRGNGNPDWLPSGWFGRLGIHIYCRDVLKRYRRRREFGRPE
jgi:hypothetical protein